MSEEPQAAEEKLPDYVIEGARSSRAKCKTCRRKIDKGTLRLGILIEGPYGTGYMWHHIRCAARRHYDRLAEAYETEAWNNAQQPPDKVPDLESLAKLREQAEEKKKKRKTLPYAELDPSGRARCKQCEEILEKGTARIALGRGVMFGNQERVAAINVHPRCVAEALNQEDCVTEPEGLAEALRANSTDLAPEILEAAIAEAAG